MTNSSRVRSPAMEGWDALLSDGSLIRIRPALPADAAMLRALHDRASDDSYYLRFFSMNRKNAARYVDRLFQHDGQTRLALVAEERGVAVGMASCERLPGTADAEVALLVVDPAQRHGIGTLLLEHLAAMARHAGIRRFVAEILSANSRVLEVFANVGFSAVRTMEQGVTSLTIPLAPTPEAQQAVDTRERAADVRSLAHIMTPRSVAVVGASDRPGSVGGALLRNLVTGGFQGPVYPVNLRHRHVGGRPAYRSVTAIPGAVDLAVVAVPATAVPDVIADCGAHGVPAAVVVTAGFGERGSDGAGKERELLQLARSLGVRLVGPNCLGVACTDPAVRLNATFSATPPTPGPIGVASQSGALGIALLGETAQRGLGVSGFVSLGNKLDVSANDLLLYWEDDPRTRVIALYLESIGNPRKFARHAGRVGRRKPVIALTAGRSSAGSRAGASHTAAVATPEVIVSALLRQAGVVRVPTSSQLLDVAQLLAMQPVPPGVRLGVLGNSGGPGILAADAAADCGLHVPELTGATQAAIRRAAPGLAAASNPVDLGAAAGPDAYEHTLTALLRSGEVDAAVVIYASPLVSDPTAVASAVRHAAARTPDLSVAAVLLGTDAASVLTDPAESLPAVPSYDFPEPAVQAMGCAAAHGAWLRRPSGVLQRPAGMDADAARAVAVQALASDPAGRWLNAHEATRLLASVGVPLCPFEPARSPDEAVAAAARIGYPVVLKTAAAVPHKTELGGVRVGLCDADEVRSAYPAVAAAGGDASEGTVVQPVIPATVELLVGVSRVEPYPPLVLVGLGGTTAELLHDTAVRLAPLTDADAREVIRELRSAPLLFGFRGQPGVHVPAIESLLLRVAALADEVPELAELDLNPVMAGPDGVLAVDVKARVAPITAEEELLRDPLVRTMR